MSSSPYDQASFFDALPEAVSFSKWQKTIDLIANIFEAPGAFLMQANTKGIEAIVTSESMQENFPAGTHFAQEVDIYCKTVIKSKDILYVRNAEKEGGWDNNPEYSEAGFVSYLGVPILWPDGDVFGTLCVLDSKESSYPERFIALMWQLKELIDSDLKNLILIEQLELQSTTDELTGIFNRRGFLTHAENLIGLAKRNSLELCLMSFDLNKLKLVNDSLGHEAGDFLLQSFAHALAKTVREEDVTARLGGDEFCFIGIHYSQDEDKVIESRIQTELTALTHLDGRIQDPSFSTGYKVFKPIDGFKIDSMLAVTDSLMYKNKANSE